LLGIASRIRPVAIRPLRSGRTAESNQCEFSRSF
jgi:hypothetical protein